MTLNRIPPPDVGPAMGSSWRFGGARGADNTGSVNMTIGPDKTPPPTTEIARTSILSTQPTSSATGEYEVSVQISGHWCCSASSTTAVAITAGVKSLVSSSIGEISVSSRWSFDLPS